jgi:outer membrane autotransporter protein
VTANTLTGSFAAVDTLLESPTLHAVVSNTGNQQYSVSLSRSTNAYSRYAGNVNGAGVGQALEDAAANHGRTSLSGVFSALDFSAVDGSDVRAALPQLSAEVYASATGVLVNASGATRSAVNNHLQKTVGFTSTATDQTNSNNEQSHHAAWGTAYGNWASQSGNNNTARTTSTLGGFTMGIDTAVSDTWRMGVLAGYSHSTFKTADRGSSGSSENYTLGAYAGTQWPTSTGAINIRSGVAYSWHDAKMTRSVMFAGFNDQLSADYHAGTFQAFGEAGYKLNIGEQSAVEPYANLAYVPVRTDSVDEKGSNGAALSVRSASFDTTLSTLGVRASTVFELGEHSTTARADLGWRHAYGDVNPATKARFVGGSTVFTALGSSIGRDTALLETGLDIQLNRNAALALSYQGQFGSGFSQNSVNASLNVRF